MSRFWSWHGARYCSQSLLGAAGILACCVTLAGEPVTVRYVEGSVHGFLALRTLAGATIADGDLIQSTRGDRVTTELALRFTDGSLHDETAVYSQRRAFRLLTDHLVQKGPSFPQPLDMMVDARGDVTVHYTNDHGEPQVTTEHLDLPPDVANGVILTLLKNVRPNALPNTLSFVAATPKPRLVKLRVTAAGQEPFSTGVLGRTATHYIVKVDIGGVAGLLAPLLGKQPPDSHVWILGGDAPAIVKAEQPLYLGGPVWRIELVSPSWSHQAAALPKTVR
jgi:hypothetical protein